VELVLLTGTGRQFYPMQPEERGFFSFTLKDVAEGQRYLYRLDGKQERADPASPWQPGGVGGPSAVVRPRQFAWTDQGWKGVPREDLVFYELHVGTYTPQGTFDAIIPRLGSLRDLGVTAIELMPVGQFPGGRNWGYDGVYLYAPQDSYGGPQGLHRLVNAAHSAGLAVFLDVVYNHVGPEGNYLGQFGPYFTGRYRTFWGPAFNYDDAGSDSVRAFVINNARSWIEDYHFDGLRLDAVHAIFDFSPTHILQEVQDAVAQVGRRTGRHVHVIAESDLNDARLVLPPEQGGYGLGGQWSDDFHHVVHTTLTGERQGYYADYSGRHDLPRVLEQPFLYCGQYSPFRDRQHGGPSRNLPGSRFVVCVQNHDQVGNRARGDRLTTLITPPARRLAASLLLLSPHLPLLFMGEEYGEEAPFQFFCSFEDPQLVENVRKGRRQEFALSEHEVVPDPQDEATFAASRLSWSWQERPERAGLRRLYRDLLAARRNWPALKDFQQRASRLHARAKGPAVLELIRGSRAVDPDAIQVFFNLTAEPLPLPRTPHEGFRLLFSSEAAAYGGARQGPATEHGLLPCECQVFGPPGWEALQG
jgi:maltooligosyltrehalose trehalohydrolase